MNPTTNAGTNVAIKEPSAEDKIMQQAVIIMAKQKEANNAKFLKDSRDLKCKKRGSSQRAGAITTVIIFGVMVVMFLMSHNDNFSLDNINLKNYQNNLQSVGL